MSHSSFFLSSLHLQHAHFHPHPPHDYAHFHNQLAHGHNNGSHKEDQRAKKKKTFLAQLFLAGTSFVRRNIQMLAVIFGLMVTALVQPLFVTFMILLWIGDEAFKAYFMDDILALVNLSKPTGSVFEMVMRWSTMSFVCGICGLFVCLVGYLKWKDQQGRGIFSLIASPDLNNKLKPYFIVYYSAWLLIYWFEITVIFFGYIGKLALLVYGTDTVLEVNAEHNFIGLCFLVLFIILITLADFVVQDIFNLRSTAPEVMECQRQE